MVVVVAAGGCRRCPAAALFRGRPAGCAEPEQSCPGLARQPQNCLSMKSPCCVRNIHGLQVSCRFNGSSVSAASNTVTVNGHSFRRGEHNFKCHLLPQRGGVKLRYKAMI